MLFSGFSSPLNDIFNKPMKPGGVGIVGDRNRGQTSSE